MENWFVMVNAPVNQGQDWDALAAGARKVILQRLNTVLGKDIEPAIMVEKFNSPRDLQEKTGASLGAIYGRNSNSMFAAFQRHPNRLSSVKNLALAGGTVHPGGGIPLCLLSARLATNLIIQK
jgi:phytoene dehydrogenase-like protein